MRCSPAWWRAGDSADTTFFYTGTAGAVAITLVAPFFWTPMQGAADWLWMGALCATAVLGHFLLIKAYEVAEAGTVQPFAYFQLVFIGILGLTLFDERPDAWTVAGGGLILGAGLYTLIREARLGRARPEPVSRPMPPRPTPRPWRSPTPSRTSRRAIGACSSRRCRRRA